MRLYLLLTLTGSGVLFCGAETWAQMCDQPTSSVVDSSQDSCTFASQLIQTTKFFDVWTINNCLGGSSYRFENGKERLSGSAWGECGQDGQGLFPCPGEITGPYDGGISENTYRFYLLITEVYYDTEINDCSASGPTQQRGVLVYADTSYNYCGAFEEAASTLQCDGGQKGEVSAEEGAVSALGMVCRSGPKAGESCFYDALCGKTCSSGPKAGESCFYDSLCEKTCSSGPKAGESCFYDSLCGKTCSSGPKAGESCFYDSLCGKTCSGGTRTGSICYSSTDCPGGTCVQHGCYQHTCYQHTCYQHTCYQHRCY